MARIDSIVAEEVKDSRGMPTVMVTMRSDDLNVSAKVPSGKSAGSREAHEMRDADGKGVFRAIENVGLIAKKIKGMELDSRLVDSCLLELDGTENKTGLGANATLGVSIAAIKLSAIVNKVPLWKHIAELSNSVPGRPRLYMNMLNGGVHSDFRLPFQEYIVVSAAPTLTASYEKASNIFVRLGEIVKSSFGEVLMGDEGGYSPATNDIEKPFELLEQAVGKEPDIFFAIDAAASELFHDGSYSIGGKSLSSDSLYNLYIKLIDKYNLKSIEDPFNESDFDSFETITRSIGKNIIIVGDDLTVTNPKIVKEMVNQKRANAMIVKPNQIGTITEAFKAIDIAREAEWKLIASHRSGETDDTFISDFAVGIGAFGIKAGAPSQKERLAKYTRLLEIDQELTKFN